MWRDFHNFAELNEAFEKKGFDTNDITMLFIFKEASFNFRDAYPEDIEKVCSIVFDCYSDSENISISKIVWVLRILVETCQVDLSDPESEILETLEKRLWDLAL